jgi:exopolysaccharide biosynthesis protein
MLIFGERTVNNRFAFYLLLALTALANPGSQAQSPANDSSTIPPDSTVTIGDMTVRVWNHPRMVIVSVPDTVVFCYLPRNGAPLDSVARREDLRCLINGSFFNGVRGDASHAGLLSIYGKYITPLMDDRQLTHVVRTSGSRHTTSFLPVRSFKHSTDPGDVEFQTGPLIIENGKIRDDLIRSSINGSSRHTRTLLATLDHHRCFFITVDERVTLSDLAASLVRLRMFKEGRLDVVNLDGGSSVALYLRDVPHASVNVDDRLPILIGFR